MPPRPEDAGTPASHEAAAMTELTPTHDLALDLTLRDDALEAAIADARRRAIVANWADRAIGRRDPSVWSGEEIVQRSISIRLGWLEAPFHFADEAGELEAFAAGIRDQGFTSAVLGGMGGSSLAPV